MFSGSTTPCHTCGQEAEHCDTYKNCDDCATEMRQLLKDWADYDWAGPAYFPKGFKDDMRIRRDEILKGAQTYQRKAIKKRKNELRNNIIEQGIGRVVQENEKTHCDFGLFNDKVMSRKRLDKHLIKEILKDFHKETFNG